MQEAWQTSKAQAPRCPDRKASGCTTVRQRGRAGATGYSYWKPKAISSEGSSSSASTEEASGSAETTPEATPPTAAPAALAATSPELAATAVTAPAALAVAATAQALVAPAAPSEHGNAADKIAQGGEEAAKVNATGDVAMVRAMPPRHPPPPAVPPPAAPQVQAKQPAVLDDREVLVRGVAAALTTMASLPSSPKAMTRFHCKYPPSMSIGDYIARIRRFFGCDAPCYVLALLYIDRLMKLRPEMGFSPLSSHRLIITAVTLAAKFHEDIFYSNKYYAKVGGVPLRELNMLEHCFLEMLDWKLSVTLEEYEIYARLARQAATPKLVAEAL